MMGVAIAGVAEGMALADRAGLQQRDVLEILELTSLSCPLLTEKGKGSNESFFSRSLSFIAELFHFSVDRIQRLSLTDESVLSITYGEYYTYSRYWTFEQYWIYGKYCTYSRYWTYDNYWTYSKYWIYNKYCTYIGSWTYDKYWTYGKYCT